MKPEPAPDVRPGGERRVLVCRSEACAPRAELVRSALTEALERAGLNGEVKVHFTGCRGFCPFDPSVLIEPEGTLYLGVAPADAPDIVRTDILGGRRVERLLPVDPGSGRRVSSLADLPYFAPEHRVVLRHCGLVDPGSIEDALRLGAYRGLKKALGKPPLAVLEEIEASGLRGRGSRGYPVALKWRNCLDAPGDGKIVICNAEEGDPGCLTARTLLEGDPHGVIEGMAIAGYVVGASRSILCVHDEAEPAIRSITEAIAEARARNLLGTGICGTPFDFDIEVRPGPGGLVRSDETALLATLEGRRGMPRPGHTPASSKGLFGSPSLIHWVETFASFPAIVDQGPEWFATIGRGKEKGTRVLSVWGSVVRGGVMEVPLGTPLMEVVQDLGGGLPEGRRLKALHMGGPTGGFIPAELAGTPLESESLEEVGALPGSGSLLVLDESACVVDVARHLLDSIGEESCGKCVPCRLGTAKLAEILSDIVQGRARSKDLEQLAALAKDVRDGSLCVLGQTAPNPVLSGLRHFREEFEAHVLRKECPARVCVDLMRFEVDPTRCTRCGACAEVCPEGAVSWAEDRPAVIEIHRCTRCRACVLACGEHAID